MSYVVVIPTSPDFKPTLTTGFGVSVTWTGEDNIFPYSEEVARLTQSKQITTQPASEEQIKAFKAKYTYLVSAPQEPVEVSVEAATEEAGEAPEVDKPKRGRKPKNAEDAEPSAEAE